MQNVYQKDEREEDFMTLDEGVIVGNFRDLNTDLMFGEVS